MAGALSFGVQAAIEYADFKAQQQEVRTNAALTVGRCVSGPCRDYYGYAIIKGETAHVVFRYGIPEGQITFYPLKLMALLNGGGSTFVYSFGFGEGFTHLGIDLLTQLNNQGVGLAYVEVTVPYGARGLEIDQFYTTAEKANVVPFTFRFDFGR